MADLLSELDQGVAEGSTSRKELAATEAGKQGGRERGDQNRETKHEGEGRPRQTTNIRLVNKDSRVLIFFSSFLFHAHHVTSDLTQAEEALRVAEEAVAVSRIAALERRAKPVRRANRAVKARGMAGGLRQVFKAGARFVRCPYCVCPPAEVLFGFF